MPPAEPGDGADEDRKREHAEETRGDTAEGDPEPPLRQDDPAVPGGRHGGPSEQRSGRAGQSQENRQQGGERAEVPGRQSAAHGGIERVAEQRAGGESAGEKERATELSISSPGSLLRPAEHAQQPPPP